MASRGVRNNNPGNIDHNPRNKWQGLADPPLEQGVPKPRFARFVSPAYGIRAIAVLLITYQDKRLAADGSRIDTLAEIVERWAPAVENNTNAYINAVDAAHPLSAFEQLDVHRYDHLFPLVKEIIHHENGYHPYSDDVITQGLLLAGVRAPQKAAALKPEVVGTATTVAAGALPDLVDQMQPALAEAGVALEPVAVWSPWVRILCTVLAVVGAGLLVYGLIKRHRRTGE